MDTTRVVAARRSVGRSDRRTGRTGTRHVLRRHGPATPQQIGDGGIRSSLSTEDVGSHRTVRPRAANISGRWTTAAWCAISQFAQHQRVGGTVHDVGHRVPGIASEHAAQGRLCRVSVSVSRFAIASGIVAASQVLHIGAVRKALLVPRMRRAIHDSQVCIPDGGRCVCAVPKPIHRFCSFGHDLGKVPIQGSLIDVREQMTNPRTANSWGAAAILACRIIGPIGRTVHRTRREHTRGTQIVMQPQSQLLQLVPALSPARRLSCLLNSWQ